MEERSYLDRITFVSGGQTGIDRAMLDFCLDNGISCGGWCPEGRKAEDGTIDARYPVKVLPGASYSLRTKANVVDSDVTVIIYLDELQGGTLQSYGFVQHEHKPFLLLDMLALKMAEAVRLLNKFLTKHQPLTVNFSGPRLSEWPDGYRCCYTLLQLLFL